MEATASTPPDAGRDPQGVHRTARERLADAPASPRSPSRRSGSQPSSWRYVLAARPPSRRPSAPTARRRARSCSSRTGPPGPTWPSSASARIACGEPASLLAAPVPREASPRSTAASSAARPADRPREPSYRARLAPVACVDDLEEPALVHEQVAPRELDHRVEVAAGHVGGSARSSARWSPPAAVVELADVPRRAGAAPRVAGRRGATARARWSPRRRPRTTAPHARAGRRRARVRVARPRARSSCRTTACTSNQPDGPSRVTNSPRASASASRSPASGRPDRARRAAC